MDRVEAAMKVVVSELQYKYKVFKFLYSEWRIGYSPQTRTPMPFGGSLLQHRMHLVAPDLQLSGPVDTIVPWFLQFEYKQATSNPAKPGRTHRKVLFT
ncbi:hypothetical protein [Variovorax sp. KK3]